MPLYNCPPGIAAFIPFQAYAQSDLIGKAIVLLLIGLSMYIWTVIINKTASLADIRKYNALFLKFYRSVHHPAIPYLDERKLVLRSPMVHIYMAAARELMSALRRAGADDDELRDWQAGETGVRLGEAEIQAIRGAAERVLATQQLDVEKHMSSLATVTTAAPSIGLFGTVWGVMGAFMAMASGGSSLISSVAPGISSALLTTVVGLVVAIPSAISYNALSERVRAISVELEGFIDEYIADIARIHGSSGGRQP